MIRKIIFFENHFIEFYQNQNAKVKSKIQYVFELLKQVERVPKKFLKYLIGTNGLYEIRIECEANIYRIFCCFDKDKLVVLFNAYQKKTQKTSKKELDKAQKLMKTYFEQKNKDNG